MTHVRVGDAFVRGIPAEGTWTIGTKAVEMAFGATNGLSRLVGFRNKLAGPPQEYIAKACAVSPFTLGANASSPLVLTGASAREAVSGGQPVAMLALELAAQGVKVRYRVVAYPGTSVLRQHVSLENAGTSPITADATLLTIPVTDALAASFTHFWMVGGNSGTDHGTMRNAVVGPGYCQAIQAQATSAFVPWTALQRAHEPGDGWFVAVEYLGNWTLAVERRPDGPAVVSAGIADLAAVPLGPGERIELPAVTIGAFAGSLDDMGVRSYDWQYRYRWDCTNMDYYARPKWAVAWTYCARNLQEQFAERLAYLDMDADLVRAVKSDVPIEGAWPTEEDAALYQHGRQGREFAYSIPVPAGLYSVRLKFAEPRYEWLFERPFHVSVNGREVLRNFDICQDARGCRKAHDRVFRYVVPNAEGQIVLRFSAGSEPGRKTGPALVQAIEVVPEIRPVVRISCGAEAEFIDWNSLVWSADCGFSGGRPIGSSATVAQASPTLYDQALYQTARAGRSFCYALSLPPGLYAVHVKVAELWLMDPGKRPMDIAINGKTVWRSWDAAAAGQVGMACDLRALNITPDKTGTIAIQARAAGENDAILQAIEVE